MMPILWTKEETEILKQIVDNDGDLEDAAKIIPCRSPQAIRQKMDTLGLKFKSKNVIDMEAFKKFLKEKG